VGLFDDFVDAVGDAVDAVGDAIEDAVEDTVDAVEDVVDAIGDAAEDAVDALGELAEDAIDALGDLAEDALDTVEDVYEAFAELAEEVVEGAVDIVEQGWNALADSVEDAWEAIADAAEDAWQSIEDAAESAWEDITDAVETLWEDAQHAVETVFEAAADAAEHLADAVDAMEATLTWLGDLIKDIAYAIAMLGACLAGIIVHNLAEADNILLNFWKVPKRLSDRIKTDAAPLFPDVPLDRVLYIENASLSANHFSDGTDAMTFSHVEIAGVNFAYMIYVKDTIDDTVLTDRGLMIHELVHVDQYRRFGFEDAFACAYGVGFADAGLSYENNPLEAQAFAVQRAFVAAGGP
jgi:ElaB/YqjD/DUF883 family membrane-anchored ribosome-binding protein